MAAFNSPLENPGTWTLSSTNSTTFTVPGGMRYAGEVLRGVRATRVGGGPVRVIATSSLRRVDVGSGVVVEAQTLPFPNRRVASAIRGGLPTFYFAFDDATGLTFNNGDSALGNDVLRSADAVTIACAFEDRIVREPARWADELAAAVTAGGGTLPPWASFQTALSAATNSAPSRPIMVLGHDGRPARDSQLVISFGPGDDHPITLIPADGGDLQACVARLAGSLGFANLWGTHSAFQLRPTAAGAAFQLARLEDSVAAVNEIAVVPTARHIQISDLHRWFAPQNASPPVGVPALARFTRGNRVRALVNGPEFYDDFFVALRDAAFAGGGVHLAGWAMKPNVRFPGFRTGDVATDLTLAAADAQIGADLVPLTLEQAVTRIAAAGGAARFLPAQFLQLRPGSTAVPVIIMSTLALTAGLLALSSTEALRTDAVGDVVALLGWVALAVGVASVFSDAAFVEPNSAARDVLGTIASTVSRLSPYPATVADNPNAPPSGDPVFAAVFDMMESFGIHHQKMGVVRTPSGHIGYCGGIDLNDDRLDTVDHLTRLPYHDVHTRVEGPAVRDLALTFESRWARDGGGTTVAFPTPSPPATGSDAVQVARTYFRPTAPSRALAFAPTGDRTLHDTVVRAIQNAREFIYIEDQYFTPPHEYREALLAKLAENTLRRLVIAMPGITDQPFGEEHRSLFIQQIRAAAPPGVVLIGYPRRRVTLPDNDIRASSGRLRLEADLPATAGPGQSIMVGPRSRLPSLPFWLQIDGELMYVNGPGATPSPDSTRIVSLMADRGADTRLLSGTEGATVKAHEALAPATVVDLTNIYVHAKMMIVDDVFLSVGSANLNRRGFFHDGEANVFSVPETLRTSPTNSIAALRRKLWAEMADMPLAVADALLEDPVAGSRLLERPYFAGNRFVPIEALPPHLMVGLAPSNIVTTVLDVLLSTTAAAEATRFWNGVADPTSTSET